MRFHDRGPLCTVALARWLGYPEPDVPDGGYQREVFLVQPLGFMVPTAARRISYADSLRFGAVHEQVYAERGYRLIRCRPVRSRTGSR